jgi:hypothetical protein
MPSSYFQNCIRSVQAHDFQGAKFCSQKRLDRLVLDPGQVARARRDLFAVVSVKKEQAAGSQCLPLR